VSGNDRRHARDRQCSRCVDISDASVGIGAAYKGDVLEPGQLDIAYKGSFTGDQSGIFFSLYSCANKR
jgi:hypothetical protein